MRAVHLWWPLVNRLNDGQEQWEQGQDSGGAQFGPLSYYFLSSLNSTAQVGDSDIELECKQHGAVGSARGPYHSK